MYGIRMKRSENYWNATKPGHIWVDKTLETYTVKRKAMLWKTKKEAEYELSEPWEYVVKV